MPRFRPCRIYTPSPYLHTPIPYGTLVSQADRIDSIRHGNPMQNIVLTISEMSCGHCLNAVNRAVQSVADVELESVRLGHAALKAPDDATVERVKAAIEQAGYRVEGVSRG